MPQYPFPRKKKKRFQKANIILFILSRLSGFRFFPTIPDYFESFLKATENVRSLQVEEKSKNFPLYFRCEEYIFDGA